MNKSFLILLLAIMGISMHAQAQTSSQAAAAVRAAMDRQAKAWNDANIEQFMEEYWKSDSLLFIGADITTGWKGTLERYKKAYPGKEGMGQLRFELLRINSISKDACLVTGKFFLTRKNDHPTGNFTVLFRLISGKWVIVYDHSNQTGK